MAEIFDRYPLQAFFILSFSVAWVIWSISPLLAMGDEQIQTLIDIIGLFSKALIALIITLRRHNLSLMPSIRRHLSLFGVFSAIILFVMSTGFIELTIITVILALILADLLAYLIGMLFTYRHHEAVFWNRIHRLKRPATILVWASFPLLFLIALFIGLMASESWFWPFFMGSVLIYHIFFVLLIIFFTLVGSALIFELAYRGFLAPYFIQKSPPLISGLAMGALMVIWLFPLFVNGFFHNYGFNVENLRFMLNILFWLLPLNVILMWIYLRFKGVMWFAYIAHGGFFTALIFMPLSDSRNFYVLLLLWVSALCLSLFDRRMRDGRKARFYLHK